MSGKLQALQAELEEANLGHLELASAGRFVTIAGIVRTPEERDRAIALAKAAGFTAHDSITVDDGKSTDELAIMLRAARGSQEPIPILKRAVAMADERGDVVWRVGLRLELDAALRGPLRYVEAVAVCREAIAIEESPRTLYALAYCLQEGSVGFVKPAEGEIEGLYLRVLALTKDDASSAKIHDNATRMLAGHRTSEELRRARTSS